MWVIALALMLPIADEDEHPAARNEQQQCAVPPATRVLLDSQPDGAQLRRVLRISADPNNLPFTNQRLEGFENRIAAVIASELEADLEYIWRAQRRGFFRQALKEGECDIVLGVPTGFEMALTTIPYYRSTYVFVTRKDRNLTIRSLDDPSLRDLRIGVQLVGDDGANPPAAHALAARGIIHNVVGFTVYGDYAESNPPARVMDAVVRGDVDVAVVWGPLAGDFARTSPAELDLAPVSPAIDTNGLPFTFKISIGVRKGNAGLRDELNAILERRRDEIDKILDEFGVPRLPTGEAISAR